MGLPARHTRRRGQKSAAYFKARGVIRRHSGAAGGELLSEGLLGVQYISVHPVEQGLVLGTADFERAAN